MATTPGVETAPPTAGAAEAWRLIFVLGPVHRARVLAAAAEPALPPPQLFLLRRLQPDTPTPMSELATFFGCDASNITGLVDRLEPRGFLGRRVPAPVLPVEHILLSQD